MPVSPVLTIQTYTTHKDGAGITHMLAGSSALLTLPGGHKSYLLCVPIAATGVAVCVKAHRRQVPKHAT
jgi:hypothetical protein